MRLLELRRGVVRSAPPVQMLLLRVAAPLGAAARLVMEAQQLPQ